MDISVKRIMIFDDDEDILSICKYVLEEEGWQVYAYPDCKDLLARIRADMPHVILMDNWIPDEGGIVATQIIKKDPVLRNIPVIYFSANSYIESLAATAGADDYLAKPFEIEDLKATVLAMIRR